MHILYQKWLLLFLIPNLFSKTTVFTTDQLSSLMTTTQELGQKKQLFWHHTIPTVGLRRNKHSDCPFIPHFFSLWELAPKKGRGAKIAVIDTGIAARSKDEHHLEIHTQLNHQLFFLPDCLHLMNYDMQGLINNFTMILNKHTGVSQDECKKTVIHFLYEYPSTKSFTRIINFLNKYDCYAAYIIDEFRNILDNKLFFTPIKINNSKPVFLELLPITLNTFGMASHGTVLCGIIGAREHISIGPLGIAPQAEIIMIKAFDEYGCSNKATLLQALTKVHELGVSIVNMSLKISDHWCHDDLLSGKIEKCITQIPYVIAASGNSVDAHALRHEAYPARLPSVAFDVGAFDFDGEKTYSITSFSQYEIGIGPKIVAPGFNILSTLLTDDPTVEYGLFHGTSIATAIVTGFVALVVSEFGEYFTREQLLKVCYKATVRLHLTNEWQAKTLLGTIDMRCALFMLHALYRFKELSVIGANGLCDFNRDFDGLLSIIHHVLCGSVGTDMRNVDNNGCLIRNDLFHCYFSSLAQAVEYVVGKMFMRIHSDKVNSFSLPINLFSSLSCVAQRRIQSVF